jgi:Cu+-exporting ATPase
MPDNMSDTEDAVAENVQLNVAGMTCTNCALGISKYLEKQGLENVSVNFATNEVRFKANHAVKLPDIEAGIEKLGFQVIKAPTADEHGHTHPVSKGFTIERKLLFCALFTIPLLLHMFWHHPFLMNPWVQLALSTPVMLVGLWHFGRSAIASLRTGVPNMDVLITIGASAAFGYSLAGAIMQLGPNFLFFETAATIITLVLLGNVIEHRSVQQTTTAIGELTKLQVQVAKRLTRNANGQEQVEEVNASLIRRGDVVQVNTGDKVPFDGKIIWGQATIDEALVTGESIPAEREVNQKVIGGTLVANGSIHVLVEAVGEKTYLAQIIELVKSAQQDKPSIQRLADRVSAIFVPVVILLAIVAFLLAYFALGVSMTDSLLRSIAVLAIACPCAMGLATPTAIMVGVGRVTREGILIKGGKTVEQLANVKQIVFDKTGTLTTGNFKTKTFKLFQGSEAEAISVLLSLELKSSHPIAKSLVKEYKGAEEIAFTHTEEIKGSGIRGFDGNGNVYESGSYQLARNHATDHTFDVYILKNNELIAAIELQDEIKPEAQETINYLNRQGIKSILLSGDRYEKCYQVATTLGIDAFYAERKPHEKLDIITELSKNTTTAMVGDGINDAPALAKATIGISLSNATEVAIDSSQVILLNGNLAYLAEAIKVSKATVTTIKQNLFWAFAYNLVAIPIAMAGLLNPMVAALSMAFSDVVVVGNSIRLKYRRLKG